MTAARSVLPASIQRLVSRIEQSGDLTPGRARQLLQEWAPPEEVLAAWTDFDHPVTNSYGRRMVHDGGEFELMVMSWVPGDMSAIHDHGHTQWGAVRLYGAAEHAIFRLRDGELTTTERGRFQPGDVLAVGHDLIHQMGNVGAEPFVTLHLYGCTGKAGAITADAHVYELFDGTVQVTDGGVFFALPNAAVTARTTGPRADLGTVDRHNVELLRRLLAIDRERSAGERPDERLAVLTQWVFETPMSSEAAEALRRELNPGREARLELLVRELRTAVALQLELVRDGRVDLSETRRDAAAVLLGISDTRSFAAKLLESHEVRRSVRQSRSS